LKENNKSQDPDFLLFAKQSQNFLLFNKPQRINLESCIFSSKGHIIRFSDRKKKKGQNSISVTCIFKTPSGIP
jgi:hypothetical protein